MLRALWFFLVTFVHTSRARRARGPLRPSWTFTFEWVVRYLRYDWDQTSNWPDTKVRAATDARPYPQNMVRKVARRDETLGGVPVRWFEPKEVRAPGVVLFFHGGSYVYGSARTSHADLCARLALATRTRVVGADYRLAPEHVYPAQLDDALAVFDALVASGIAPSDIVIAGDSAGGNLAFYLAARVRDRGGPSARAVVLLSPWSDLSMPGRSFVTHDAFDFGTREVLVRQAKAFAGDVPLDDPRLSPVHAEAAGLPPSLVVLGEVETPRDDIERLVQKLEAAGNDVTVHRAADMPHNPALFAAYHPSGAGALEAMTRFIVARLGHRQPA